METYYAPTIVQTFCTIQVYITILQMVKLGLRNAHKCQSQNLKPKWTESLCP